MEKNITSVGEERLKEKQEKGTAALEGKTLLSEQLGTGYRPFFEYLEWLGLSDESRVLVLTPNNHYYYHDEELKDVKVLVNLKHLNNIKQLKDFLSVINTALSNRSYLTGSFIDRKHQYSFFPNSLYNNNQEGADAVENGISSRIPLLNMIYDFIDSRTNNRNLTRKSVRMLLEVTGFKVLDMTEVNGVTLFCAQKTSSS